MLLTPDRTCWRLAEAERVATLIDSAAYFRAAREALYRARRSVLLLGWNFDPRTPLNPDAPDCDRIGPLLNRLAGERPGLDVRILIWNMALPLAWTHGMFPQRATFWFDGKVDYRLASSVAVNAAHHQKVLVIDDTVAFCGGGDFAAKRWDTRRHRDRHPLRVLPSGETYPPRHEVMLAVAGDAARALGDLARMRWREATGEDVAPPPPRAVAEVWPDGVEPGLMDVPVAVARTEPQRPSRPPVRENEALHVAAIAAARRSVYLENQYFASPVIADALAARLAEPDGPEVMVVCPQDSPGVFERLCIDSARDPIIRRLQAADRHGRFGIYAPLTEGGSPIVIHSKVTVIDDWLLRAGSANLANRSMRVDTECDLAIDARMARDAGAARRYVLAVRDNLIGHFLGVERARFAAAVAEAGGLHAAIRALDGEGGRLPRLRPRDHGGIRSLLARHHFFDPVEVRAGWRPWTRLFGGQRSSPEMRKSITTGR